MQASTGDERILAPADMAIQLGGKSKGEYFGEDLRHQVDKAYWLVVVQCACIRVFLRACWSTVLSHTCLHCFFISSQVVYCVFSLRDQHNISLA